MNIKPIYISLFIIAVLASLFGLTYLSKSNPTTEQEGYTYKDFQVKYPTTESFLEITTDSSNALRKIEEVTTIIKPLEIEEKIDSIPKKQLAKIKKDSVIIPDFSSIDTTKIERITYPINNLNFKDEIKKHLSSKQCRILHYGDSQLEGDRITGYLRNRLQKMYGGNGPGFIPIKQVYHQISANVEANEVWSRHALFDPTQKKLKHRKYGSYLSMSRFTKPVEDSIILDSLPITKATIKIGKSNRTYRKFRSFTNIGLHYGNCQYPIKITIFNNGNIIKEDSLITDQQYHKYTINLPSTPTDLEIRLEGKVSADFYGLTLDGTKGIQIDNIAMRGASGTIFARNNALNFSRMSKNLDPKIIIMQYGGNAVPYLKDSLEVRNYANHLLSQIKWLKRRKSNTNILFIGPTDLSTSINGKMVTYKLLPYLNQTLKETCITNNVAYWNMFNAMGGKNSMPLWVQEKLAGSDYVHFTPKGTKYISELFFLSLYLDLKEENEQPNS